MAQQSAWPTLYKNALQCDPERLLETVQIARQAIYARLRLIGPILGRNEVREQRELFLALADLCVLRSSFLSRSAA